MTGHTARWTRSRSARLRGVPRRLRALPLRWRLLTVALGLILIALLLTMVVVSNLMGRYLLGQAEQELRVYGAGIARLQVEQATQGVSPLPSG
ncbi:MAG: hypothetical protein ABI112_13425, partial [Terracoccus sp.]